MADDIRALRAELAEISLLVGCVKETASIRQEVNSIAAEVEKIKKEAQNKGKATDGIKQAEEQKKQQEQARKQEEEKQQKAKKEEEERQLEARKKEEQRKEEEKQQEAKKQEQSRKQEEDRKKEQAAKAAQAQADKEKKERELKAQQNKEAEEKKKREQEEKERLAQQQKAQQSQQSQQSQQAQQVRSQPAPARRSTSSSGPRTGGGTLCSDGNIFDAYDSVRADNTDIDWVVLTYENNSKLKLAGSGSGGIAKIIPFCSETECCFAYVRVVLASDESRRAKFVLISWIGENSPIMRKAKMSVHKAVVKEVFKDFSLELNATDRDDLAEARVIGALQKASGANYMGQAQR